MKMIRTMLILAAGAFAGNAAIAQTDPADHAAHHPQTPEASAKAPAAPAGPSPTAKSLEDSVQSMQAQMAKIQASKDPVERKALLEQHMQAMNQHFEMMKSVMGKSMGVAEAGAKGIPSGMMSCGQMMGGDMDMMQKMMGQMQQHLDAEGKATTPK